MIKIIKITTKEIHIDKELKARIEFICDFCNFKYTFINGSIIRTEKTNINYIEPNKIIIKDNTFLAFNHGRSVKIKMEEYKFRIIYINKNDILITKKRIK